MKSRNLAARRASRPNPSANPVGGSREEGTTRHVKRVLRSLICSAAAIGIVLTGSATAAHATPSPSKVEDQIDEQWNKLEPIIEQYNNVHNKLKANRSQAKKISDRLMPLQLEVDVAMSQVKGLAVDAYKQGSPNALHAMLITGSPTGLADKLTFLDQYARHQREQVSDVAALRDKYAADKQRLDVLTQSLAVRDADLAKTKKTIEKKTNTEVSAMMKPALPEGLRTLSQRDLAQIYQVSIRTVQRWVAIGSLPTPIRPGRSPRWSQAAITAHQAGKSR